MSDRTMRGRLPGTLLSLALAAVVAPASAAAQSDALSRVSEASLEASVVAPVAVVEALAAGSAFLVDGVQAAGASVAVTVSAVGVGTTMALYLSAETVRRLGIAAGTTISVAAIGAGWMLSAAGEALCFVAGPQVRPHIHSRRLES